MKRILLLVSAILLTQLCYAQWDGTSSSWTQGSGTQNDPYQISSPSHLAYLSDMVDSGETYQGQYFLLTQDISLSNLSWKPIGYSISQASFRGHFIGGGHLIDSIFVGDGYTNRGLFGCIVNATISDIKCNITIDGSSSGSDPISGGVVGLQVGGLIEKCRVYGNISGAICGGIVGKIQQGMGLTGDSCIVIIQNCENYATIISGTVLNIYRPTYIGGIIGVSELIGYWYYGHTHILKCGNYGLINREYGGFSGNYYVTEDVYVGGIAGSTTMADSLTMCFNKGNIILSSNNIYMPRYRIGGIRAGNGANNNINYCYNTGNISITHNYVYNSATISGSYDQIAGISYSGAGVGCYNAGITTYTYGPNLELRNLSFIGIGQYCGGNNYFIYPAGYSCYSSCCHGETEEVMKSDNFPGMLNAYSSNIIYVMDELGVNDGYPVFAYQTAYNITTDSATNVTSTAALLHGHYDGTADSVGFVYWQNGGDSINVLLNPTNTMQYQLTNLQPSSTYGYKLYVKRSGHTVYGDTVTFTTYPLYTVSVFTSNIAWGTVSGGGTFSYGDTAILSATPTSNHYCFMGWSDDSMQNPRNVYVTQNVSLVAQFEPANYTINVSSSNTLWGNVTGGGTFSYGQMTLCTATPMEGYHFTQWSDGDIGNPRIVTAESNMNLVAVFAPNQYTVTVSSCDTVKGTVSGGGTYDYNQNIFIIAIPNSGYIFTQWSDGNTEAYRSFTVIQDISFTALFANAFYEINGESNNPIYGMVVGGGSYVNGSEVTLTAMANPGYHFVQWSDGNTDNPRTITVTGNMTYFAQFAINTYNVEVVSSDVSMGSVTGGGFYNYLATATIQATPTQNHRFVQWNDGNTNNPRTIIVTSDSTFTAQFDLIEQYTITVLSDDPQRGSVTGGGTFFMGTQTIISATAAPNNFFDHWSDSNTEPYRTVTVTTDATYTAYFSPVTYIVNVFSNDDNMGTVSGGGNYEYGATATVTATPNSGCQFVRWNNGVEVNPYSFTVYSDVNLIATFERSNGIEDVSHEDIAVVIAGRIVQLMGAEGKEVRIIDVLGRQVYSSNKNNSLTIILPTAGVYMVKVGNIVKKIVIL